MATPEDRGKEMELKQLGKQAEIHEQVVTDVEKGLKAPEQAYLAADRVE